MFSLKKYPRCIKIDANTKKEGFMSTTIGQRLDLAIRGHNPETTMGILSQPGADNIPGEGDFGLGSTLNVALSEGYEQITQYILNNLPNASRISGENLGKALCQAIPKNYQGIAQSLLMHGHG